MLYVRKKSLDHARIVADYIDVYIKGEKKPANESFKPYRLPGEPELPAPFGLPDINSQTPPPPPQKDAGDDINKAA
jgi:hypothetical protein